MAGKQWTLDASDGELMVRTSVTGRAARMGHRLTIAMRQWRATARWVGTEPAEAELTVDVDSLAVLRGEGGVTALSEPEKLLVRSNALRSLGAGRFPRIRFDSGTIEPTGDGYRLTGTLQIHGQLREHVIDLGTEGLGDSWRLTAQTTVRQTDFGIKPYALLMGTVKVADEVAVLFTATHAKDG